MGACQQGNDGHASAAFFRCAACGPGAVVVGGAAVVDFDVQGAVVFGLVQVECEGR